MGSCAKVGCSDFVFGEHSGFKFTQRCVFLDVLLAFIQC
jgi:hypothetical protein